VIQLIPLQADTDHLDPLLQSPSDIRGDGLGLGGGRGRQRDQERGPLHQLGPAGRIEFDKVALIAKRHIHFTKEQAEEFGVEKGQNVQVKVGFGDRKLIFDDVAIVITEGMPEPSMDLDFEETNAAGVKAGDYVEILGI
jgi:propanediol utilization protein